MHPAVDSLQANKAWRYARMLSVLVGKTVPLCVFCRVQELFSWLIEVDGSVDEGDRGRIVFTLEYEMARGRREEYGPVRNKAVAFVSFQHDSTLAVLPVVKVCIYICWTYVVSTCASYRARMFD